MPERIVAIHATIRTPAGNAATSQLVNEITALSAAGGSMSGWQEEQSRPAAGCRVRVPLPRAARDPDDDTDSTDDPDGIHGPDGTACTAGTACTHGTHGAAGTDGTDGGVWTLADGAFGVMAGLGELVRDVPRLLTLGGLRGAVTEAAWWSAHLVSYPWGLLREEHEPSDRYHLGGLDPVQRGLFHHNVEAAGTPILLVHGIADNHAIFTVLKRRLRRRGFGTVVTINYSPLTNDIRAAAEVLAAEVEAIVALTGYERLHVIGHSLGGLIARYYVQRLGGDERVHTLVTLGTPHRGSLHAHLLPVRIGRQLRPGSRLMTDLELPAHGCLTRFVAYWSDLDPVIVPHTSARLDHPDLGARNIAISNVGHLAIPRRSDVAHEIAALLIQLDHDGHTVTTGVTPLRGETPA